MSAKTKQVRHLHLVLGDQLNPESAVFDDFDPEQDAVWMAEVLEEASHVWCHQLRIAFFFSAMRHFREALESDGKTVHYTELPKDPDEDRGKSFEEVLVSDVDTLEPEKLIVVLPGDWRVKAQLEKVSEDNGVDLEIREDRHFYSTPEEFAEWADGRKTLVLETFYRHLRKKEDILLTDDGEPEGGEWNYDKENRESFGKSGPDEPFDPPPEREPDKVTREVLELVKSRFGDHPGSLEHFDLPVTREGAVAWLEAFIEHRLKGFGKYQDAMWAGERFLNHSRLSCLLNVKLLAPREVVDAAIKAYDEDGAPINSVEGFVRQILGWREFVRGVYWKEMPDYLDLNHFETGEDLPSFFWDGETEMACVRDAMENVLAHGYAHHIQRLMVLGLFALLYGVDPRKFHDWHMAMYLDAIDWVSAPNTVGMSQYGDGGIIGTKPYCASGKYINRMSNHCRDCKFHPDDATGDDACPFTTFYWEFLSRNHDQLKENRRMTFQMKNLERKDEEVVEAIVERAGELRKQWQS